MPVDVRSVSGEQQSTPPTSARKLANLKAVVRPQLVAAVDIHGSADDKASVRKSARRPASPPEPLAVGQRVPKVSLITADSKLDDAARARRRRTTGLQARQGENVERAPTVEATAVPPIIALPCEGETTSKRKPRSSVGSRTPAVPKSGKQPKETVEVRDSAASRATERVAVDDGCSVRVKRQKTDTKADSNGKLTASKRSRNEDGTVNGCPLSGTASAMAVRPPRKKAAKAQQLAQPVKLEVPPAANKRQGDDSNEEDSNEEWEEVEELMGEDQMIKSQLPSMPVEVFLDVPDIPGLSKRKKKTFDIHAYLRRKWKKFKKDLHENTHKVHLLCFVSYGIQLNRICNSPLLHAVVMSTCGQEALNLGQLTLSSLTQLVHWFNGKMSSPAGGSVTKEACIPLHDLENELLDDLSKSAHRTYLRHVLIFLLLLRSRGTAARLVLAARPIPWKMAELKRENSRKAPLQPSSAQVSRPAPASPDEHGGGLTKPKGKQPKRGASATKASRAKHTATTASGSIGETGDSASGSRDSGVGGSKPRRSCAVGKNYSEDKERLSDADDGKPPDDAKNVKREATGRLVTRIAADGATESDDDFCTSPTITHSDPALKKRRESAPSSDDCLEMWLEVYIDQPAKWISVDLEEEVLDASSHHEAKASRPFTYVLSFDNEGYLKDVTQRYASGWMSGTQKVRVDSEWWSETLAPYRTTNHARDKAEDAQLQSFLERRPFPTSVAEFKSHPLYALKRHLLKFEAIYPESAVPLGYIKGEAIYARECVHTLHSRETWLKEAKSVRIGEKPYKMVKPRPKMNKPDEHKGEATLGVYGSWQVEDYQPPVASGGKVPRNEYGNVELFKPCMLPIGCVHLPMPALHRVAKKLNIDVAPAMVGWEGYCGYSVPQFDGWVVCEEFKDVLLSAWEQYEAEERRKLHEKKEKRVLGNWVLLVRGLFIREKLKGRFDLSDRGEPSSANGEKATDVDKAWPQNMKPASTKASTRNATELFPFEQI